MNILYIGLDNPIRVAVEGYKSEDLILTPSQGELIKEDDHYKFLVNKHGDASLYISDKKGKALDTQVFRVRRIPTPELRYGTLSSGIHSFGAIAAQNTLHAIIGDGFAYEGIRYTIKSGSYLAIFSKDIFGGELSETNKLPDKVYQFSKNRDWNLQQLIFNSAIVEGPDGIRVHSPLIITVHEGSMHYTKKGNLSGGQNYWQIGQWDYYDPNDSKILLSTRMYGDSGELKSEKNFYSHGKLKSEFDASTALYKSYYSNGKVEMSGPMLGPGDSIQQLQLKADNSTNNRIYDAGGVRFYDKDTLLFFPTINVYVPIGEWEFYHPSGALRAKGSFKTSNFLEDKCDFGYDNSTFSKPYYSSMRGPWYFYDEKGKLRYVREY